MAKCPDDNFEHGHVEVLKNTLCLLLVNTINSRMTNCNQPRTDYQTFLLKDVLTQIINSPH